MICSNFLFTFDESLSKATTYQQFQAAIVNKKGLGYHLDDDFGFANYFDNYIASYTDATQEQLQVEFNTLNIVDKVVYDINSICIEKGVNQCLKENDYTDRDQLINGNLTAYVGYYESASEFPKELMQSLYIVPMIQWKPMLMFTDILVRRKNLTDPLS